MGFIKRVAGLRSSALTELADIAAELSGMRPGPPTDTALRRPGIVITGTTGTLGDKELSAGSGL